MNPTDASRWCIAPGQTLDLGTFAVMGVVNITPDSFYPECRAVSVERAVERAARAVSDGADLLDIGAESTRPGAPPVPETEQTARLVPVIRAIRAAGGRLADVPISIDTTRAEVARAALDAGGTMINDVSAGEDDGAMLSLASERACGIVLMHRLRSPAEDSFSDRYQTEPGYGDAGVVSVVGAYLQARLRIAESAGIDPACVLLDPGLGFGKSVNDNMRLIAETGALCEFGRPVLSALSRKSFVGRVSMPDRASTDPSERLPGTIALSVVHLLAGARIFRVHDVAPLRAALEAATRVRPI